MTPELRKAIENIICPDNQTVVSHKPIGSDAYELVKHGHVVPRADGIKARCGGPAICKHCAAERVALGINPTTRGDDSNEVGL